MSFTASVKNEVTKIESNREENISELSAIIHNIGEISETIKITTENASLARHLFSLIKDLYDVTCTITIRKNNYFKKNFIYILTITHKKEEIIEDLSLNNTIPKEYIYSDDEEKKAYLRGCFLARGSINDPKTSRYHLEFLVDEKEYAVFLTTLLCKYRLNAKYLKREKGYMVYIKEAEKISDFLRLIKAYNAILYFEDIRIYRDHKNMTNRLNNCEQANYERSVNTALKQLEDIHLIMEQASLELLEEPIREVCEYRLKYPESSLTELADIITLETGKPLSKSGLNHRFRKMKELANKLR